MRVRCVAEYRGTVNHLTGEEGGYSPGAVIHVDDAVGEFLLRASPGSFEALAEPEDVDDAVGEFLLRASPGSFEALAEPEGEGGDGVADAPTKIAKGGRSR